MGKRLEGKAMVGEHSLRSG
jgi:hypothetical protein